MPFPKIGPHLCPNCKVRVKYFPVQIGVHTYTGYKCPKCEKVYTDHDDLPPDPQGWDEMLRALKNHSSTPTTRNIE